MSTGLLLIGIAAFIGTVRFAINPELAQLHGFITELATCTGLPLIAVQFAATCLGWPGREGRMTAMGASVVGFAAFSLAFPFPLYSFVVGSLSMLVVAAGAVRCVSRGSARSAAALLGAAGFALASLGLSGEGTVGPLRHIDLAHLVLALSCAGLAYGLPNRAMDRATDWD